MTNKDKYPMYALAIVAGAAIAVWAGLPLAFPDSASLPRDDVLHDARNGWDERRPTRRRQL
jgi:hypothetical protein